MASMETEYGDQGKGSGLILNHWCGVSLAKIQLLDEVLENSWPKFFFCSRQILPKKNPAMASKRLRRNLPKAIAEVQTGEKLLRV